jgi:hypothetical protein
LTAPEGRDESKPDCHDKGKMGREVVMFGKRIDLFKLFGGHHQSQGHDEILRAEGRA